MYNIKIKKKHVDEKGTYKLIQRNKYEKINISDNKCLIKTLIFDDDIEEINLDCNCKYLEQVIFNDKLETIDGRFNFCSNIKSLNFPSSLKNISFYTFGECNNLESITFNSFPKIFKSFINIHEININYNNKQLSIKVDKSYKLQLLIRDSDNANMHIEFKNDDTILKIRIDSYLNKYEKYELFKINKNQIDNNCFKLNKKYDVFDIQRVDEDIKVLDFSDFVDKNIDFTLNTYKPNINTIILPVINNNNKVNIETNRGAKIQKLIIKNDKINTVDNDQFELYINPGYCINSVKQINGYYVFNLCENKYNGAIIHSMILNSKNEYIYFYNTTIKDEFTLDCALKSNNSNSTRLNYLLNKHNISLDVLKEILIAMLESLPEEDIKDKNNNDNILEKKLK